MLPQSLGSTSARSSFFWLLSHILYCRLSAAVDQSPLPCGFCVVGSVFYGQAANVWNLDYVNIVAAVLQR